MLFPINGISLMTVGLFYGNNWGVSPIPQFKYILLYVEIPEKGTSLTVGLEEFFYNSTLLL